MEYPPHVPNNAERTEKAVTIFGVPITVCTLIEGIGFIERMIDNRRSQLVVLANVHTLNFAYELSEYKKILMGAGLVLRDGTGVKWALKKKRVSTLHNFVGTDFIPDFCKITSEKGYNFFFLGAQTGIAELAANALSRLAPGINIAGCHHGFFDKGKEKDVIRQINDSKPDILLVAFGNPKQEIWIAENLHNLSVPVCIGVGAFFDYLSGNVKRAPEWMLNIGSEWIFRLLMEPTRLWKRYLIGNPKFVMRVKRELSSQRDPQLQH